jgi:L-fuconolactonase
MPHFLEHDKVVEQEDKVNAAVCEPGAAAGDDAIPIIDTHIHLFDPHRPQGIPWPEKSDSVLFQPALPSRYREVTEGLGIAGAIVVECSPWLEDNQWVLDIAGEDTIIVGMVGNLEPGQPDFRRQLDRFHRNPLFRAIRYGNLWGRDLSAQVSEPRFISDLRALADAGLALDTANPDAALIAAIVRLTEHVPNLRVVVDHLAQMEPPAEVQARRFAKANLEELGKQPQVYVKVSEVLRRVGGQVPCATSFYRDRLDEIWDLFGPDRLLYGSDWPNSDSWGTLPQALKIVREYFFSKGRAAAEKLFWRNSISAYRWVKREGSQPQHLLE